MLLNNQLQNLVNTSHNPIHDECLDMLDLNFNDPLWFQTFTRLRNTCRYKGQPRVEMWRSELMAMWVGIHKSLEAGFQMYLGVFPCMDYMRPVVVLGIGYKYDESDIFDEGTPVCWCYSGTSGGDFNEVDLTEHGMPQPLQYIDFGFQPTDNNIRCRLNEVLGNKVVDVLADADGALRDVFEEMLEQPKPYTADAQYWLDRLELIENIKRKANDKAKKAEARYRDLQGLIASRIQGDGSKITFKAKHVVDLPKDFADKLMPHFK